MKRVIRFLLFLCILGCSQLNAQTSDTLKSEDLLNMSLKELLEVKINVSSTVPTSLMETPSIVTVIDRQTIKQYNFTSVAEALRIVSGVEVLQTVLDRNVPTVRGILQNFYANKVLILINNIPVWQPTYGNGTLDRISINDVERIEVLKGPASVLYGTNAYNGVINIITIAPDTTSVTGRITGGYPDYGQTEINYNYVKDDFRLQVFGSSLYEDRNPYLLKMGVDTLKLKETIYHGNDTIYHETYLHENDTLFYFKESYRNYTFNVKAAYKGHCFYINNYNNAYSYPGSSATYKSGANQTFKDKGTLVSYTFNKDVSKKTNIRFNTHYDYFWRDYQITHLDPLSTNFSASRIGSNFKLNHNVSERFKLEGGTDINIGRNLGHYIKAIIPDTIVRENINNEKDIVESSVFLQGTYKIKKFTILGGTRYTSNQTFKSNISSRFSLFYKINDNNIIKLMYGESFRTPNLLELYFDHTSVVGNPNLEPEEAVTKEFTYQTHYKSFFGQTSFYYTQYSNLIQRIRTSTDISIPATYINLNSFDGYGVEVELKYHNPKVISTFVQYNYMDGMGDEAEKNFQYVPNHYVSAGLSKYFNNLFVSANTSIYSESIGPWEDIPMQTNVDAHIGYTQNIKKGQNLVHTISVKNIGDSDMLIPEYIRKRPGVNTLPTSGFGRRIFYTLKLRF